MDAICQVVRCFADDNITHVSGKVNPIDDIEVINLELILADLESVVKRIDRVGKMAKQKDKAAVAEHEILVALKKHWKMKSLHVPSSLPKNSKNCEGHAFTYS